MEDIAIDELKSHLQDYLEKNGIRTDRFFRCINPEHIDRNPSMKYFDDNKVHCFGCNATYDLIGAISVIENLSRKEAFKRAIDYYGINKIEIKPKYNKNLNIKMDTKDYSKAFYIWHKNMKSNENAKQYLNSRGISDFIIEKFNLGYNEFNFGDITFKGIIIPINKTCFSARNIDKTSDFRYYKPKNAHTEIFNLEALTNSNPFCVITEGEFDCLSFEEVGINAISLGSVSNVNKFIIANKAPKTYVLALDRDEAGQTATNELIDYFKTNKMPYIMFDNCGFKDANEALVNDRTTFKKGIERVIEREIRKKLKKNEEMC